MSNLALVNNSQSPMQIGELSRDKVDLIKRTICKNATDDELSLFIHQCNRTNLDPLARQIYAVKRWDGTREAMSIQISIDGFRLIAERSGKYMGQTSPEWCAEDGKWIDVWLSNKTPCASRVGVYRTGFKDPIYGVAKFDSYAARKKDGSLMSLWAKMPEVMIAKCAESLALRKAFPQELSGLYTSDEMSSANDCVIFNLATPEEILELQNLSEKLNIQEDKISDHYTKKKNSRFDQMTSDQAQDAIKRLKNRITT